MSDRSTRQYGIWEEDIRFWGWRQKSKPDHPELPFYEEIVTIDNNKGYCPENCRWATRTQQGRNRRTNRTFEFNGESVCILELSERFGLCPHALRYRLLNGWSVDRAVNEPIRPRKTTRDKNPNGYLRFREARARKENNHVKHNEY